MPGCWLPKMAIRSWRSTVSRCFDDGGPEKCKLVATIIGLRLVASLPSSRRCPQNQIRPLEPKNGDADALFPRCGQAGAWVGGNTNNGAAAGSTLMDEKTVLLTTWMATSITSPPQLALSIL